jgi:hypothetical protein
MASQDSFNGELTANRATQPPKLVPWVPLSVAAQDALRRDAAWRRERIATAAYYIAEHRGFAPGFDTEDWGLAESQIDALDGS